MTHLFESVGLEKRLLANVTAELSDSLLDLCNQVVDDYDVMLQDLDSIGFGADEQHTLVFAILHAMANAYSATGADMSGPSAKDHDAAAQIARFMRYCAFLKKAENSR
jgi:hypothetical protein